jgi:leucyl aminopeptidase
MIELSTLTYSNMKGLGHKYAGMYGNDKLLKKKLIELGNKVHEYVW